MFECGPTGVEAVQSRPVGVDAAEEVLDAEPLPAHHGPREGRERADRHPAAPPEFVQPAFPFRPFDERLRARDGARERQPRPVA